MTKNIYVKVMYAIAVLMSLFHLYTAMNGTLEAMLQRSIHLTFGLVLAFYAYPLSSDIKTKKFDYILSFLAVIPGIYIILNYSRISRRWAFADPISHIDIMIGILLILLLVEASRRIMGKAIVVIVGVFITYGIFGQYLPNAIGHNGIQFKRIIEYLFLTTDGVFGTSLGTSATYVVLFVLFGVFLSMSGSGDYFMNLAIALTGRSRGGPAKVGIISSALFGTISGAAVANVYATGSFTIPLMKKIGYKPQFAGAVEAVASTGGQIMPPIMGSAAFIMADMLGVSYGTIIKAAILPAVLYFVSVYIMVDLEAVKTNLKGLEEEDMPNLKGVWKSIYLLLPPLVIVFVLSLGYTATYSALVGILAAIIVGVINRRKELKLSDFIDALHDGAKGAVLVAIATGVSGIIVGISTQSGLGFKFTSIITSVAEGNFYLAGFLVMISCIILGMGLPTVAAFIMVAALAAPALIRMGVDPLAAQMFVFYYCCISSITPPVALSAFAGAAIAGSDPYKTGYTSVRLGAIAFIIPFMFLSSSELLLDGSFINVILSVFSAIIGSAMLGMGIQSWFVNKCNSFQRVLLILGSIMMLYPGYLSDLIGISILLVVYIFKKIKLKNVVST